MELSFVGGESLELAQKFMEVNSVFVALFGGGILLVVGRFFNTLIQHTKNKEKAKSKDRKIVNRRLDSLEQANLAMLHNKIYRQCEDHLRAGYITLEDLDDMDYLFSAYKNLGGNGTGEAVYKEVKQLPKFKKSELEGGE